VKWRENLAKAIYDLGKIAFAALVVGQLVTPEGLQRVVFVLGVAFTVLTFVIAAIVDTGSGSHGEFAHLVFRRYYRVNYRWSVFFPHGSQEGQIPLVILAVPELSPF